MNSIKKSLKITINVFLLIIISIFFIGCSSNDMNSGARDSSNEIVREDTTRKVYYTAYYSLISKNIDEVVKKVNDNVKLVNGYIQSSSESNNSSSYVYKIPTANLNSFLDYVDDLGATNEKSINSYDITSEYSENTERLRTLNASKTAYLKLLEDDELTMNDIILINTRIEAIDTEINMLEATKALYDNKLEYSQVTINYSVIDKDNFFIRYGDYLKEFFVVLFEIIMYLLPVALISAILLFGIIFPSIKCSKKRKQKKLINNNIKE